MVLYRFLPNEIVLAETSFFQKLLSESGGFHGTKDSKEIY